MRLQTRLIQLVHELEQLPDNFPGLDRLSEEMIYLLGCGTLTQFFGTLRSLIYPEQFCLFCKPELMIRPVIKSFGGWVVKHNDFPYPNHRHHFVLFPLRHVTSPRDLRQQDVYDRFKLEEWLQEEFSITGGVSIMRLGNPRFTGATVEHAHAHFQVPEPGAGLAAAYFGKPLLRLEDDWEFLKEHRAELMANGGFQWLLDPNAIIT